VAAKRQRQLEAQLLASGDTEALVPKVPLQLQTIDLPANEAGTAKGALEAVERRAELTKAMRGERRAKIKERNFLKGMR
jgi:large subunit ribosomal protein L54